MGNIRVGHGGLNADLVKEAQKILKANGGQITEAGLHQLEQTALHSGGTITDAEQHFIASLDHQSTVQQLSNADFNPNQARFSVSSSDQNLNLASGESVRVGLGAPAFKAGKVNPSSLRSFSQLNNSDGPNAACSCNSSVAALAIKGPEALSQGLDRLLSTISPPTVEQNDDWHLLTQIRDKVDAGTATTQDLNDLASYLYRSYDSDKTDNMMKYPDVLRMRQDLGIANASTHKQTEYGPNVGTVGFNLLPSNRGTLASSTVDPTSSSFHQAQRTAAQHVLSGISNGHSAMVTVFHGSGAGTTDQPSHFIEVGKDQHGQVFVYDPLRQPRNYLTGTAAEQYLDTQIGVSLDNPTMNAAHSVETYQVRTAAPVIPTL